MNDLRHYHALLAAADARGWPENFRTDMTVHDLAFCQRTDPVTPFLWVLRASGTHIVTLTESDGVGHRAYQYPGFIESAFGAGSLYFWWDGARLEPLANAQAATDALQVAMNAPEVSP